MPCPPCNGKISQCSIAKVFPSACPAIDRVVDAQEYIETLYRRPHKNNPLRRPKWSLGRWWVLAPWAGFLIGVFAGVGMAKRFEISEANEIVAVVFMGAISAGLTGLLYKKASDAILELGRMEQAFFTLGYVDDFFEQKNAARKK